MPSIVHHKVKSPCIGVCSTGIGDSVCRGCKRFAHEIIYWNSYDEPEKRAIKNRLDTLLVQVVKAKVVVFDADLLRTRLDGQNVKFDGTSDPYTWVYALLVAGAKQVDQLKSFGCDLLPAFSSFSSVDLKHEIDRDFYILSTVHFERYFQ